MFWFDAWQTKLGKRPDKRLPVHKGWLLALAFIGCLSHPLFDWLNNYGVRLLEPFSSRWFYGDTLFIIDPWIMAMLGMGLWLSLRRERVGHARWWLPARLAFLGVTAFVTLNLGISARISEGLVYDGPSVEVASAVPLEFWRRELLWRDDGTRYVVNRRETYGVRQYSLFSRRDWPSETLGTTNMTDPRIAEWAKHNSDAQAFLFWSRMPIAELHPDRIVLRDQRFLDPRVADRFSVTLRPVTK